MRRRVDAQACRCAGVEMRRLCPAQIEEKNQHSYTTSLHSMPPFLRGYSAVGLRGMLLTSAGLPVSMQTRQPCSLITAERSS